MKIFFLGVQSPMHLGHYFFRPGLHSDYAAEKAMPFRVSAFDGLIAQTEQSHAAVIHICGWTVLTMADFSGDKRGGSSATFFIDEPKLLFADALRCAVIAFPSVIARINLAAPITERIDWARP